jgi:hypothetical protein
VIGHRRLFVSVSSCPKMILHISLFAKLNHSNGWMKPVQCDSLFRIVSLDEWMESYVISVNSQVNTKADTIDNGKYSTPIKYLSLLAALFSVDMTS